VVQAVEHLLCKSEALSSNPSQAKIKNKKQKTIFPVRLHMLAPSVIPATWEMAVGRIKV
jgi:hypothetical protein